MAAIQIYEISTAGQTITFDVEALFGGLYIYPETDPLILAANVAVNFTNTPNNNKTVVVKWGKGFDLNGNTFTINGVALTDLMASLDGAIQFVYLNGAWTSTYIVDLATAEALTGAVIKNGTIALTKLEDVTDGEIVAGGNGNVPTNLSVAGVLSAARSAATLVFSYVAGSITNAAISASAAIARTKLASGTAGHVIINDGSGIFSSEAQLATSRGGLGANVSSSTGFVTFSSGVASVGVIAETVTIPVSFEAGEVGTIFVDFPYACTVLAYQFVCTKALSGTDNGTIQFADNSGTNMTGGLATIPMSTAFGTKVGATITGNNTVALNDDIRITTAKTTAGGKGFVSITITRLS